MLCQGHWQPVLVEGSPQGAMVHFSAPVARLTSDEPFQQPRLGLVVSCAYEGLGVAR
jgi:hypothetical protein